MGLSKGYMHWSATSYRWIGDDYHTVINLEKDESGRFPSQVQFEDQDHKGVWVHRLTPYKKDISGHTYHRNTDSWSISLACMGNTTNAIGFAAFPPTEAMIEVMCKEVAKVALGMGLDPKEGSLEHRIQTHAEAAGLRDYPSALAKMAPARDDDKKAQSLHIKGIYLPHDNYGPSHWRGAPIDPQWPGGTSDKWDLWHLTKDGPPGSGGYIIRSKVVGYMKKILKSMKS